MALKVIIRNVSPEAGAELPVFIRITENKQTAFVPLTISTEAKHFDSVNERIHPDSENASEFNHIIESALRKLQLIKEQLSESEIKVTAAVLKRIFEKEGQHNFINYINNFIKELRDNGNYGTYINYRSSVKKFNSFVNKDYLDFNEVNVNLIKNFEDYLKNTLNNSVNTIYNNLKVIRKVVYAAIDHGFIPVTANPFNKYRLEKQDKNKSFLMYAELVRLQEYMMARNNPLNNVKSMFLFSCFSGLKLNVVKSLKWKDIENGFVSFKHLGAIHKIKMINKANVLIEKQKAKQQIDSNDDYIFPRYSNVYINKSLKKIALDAEINKNLTFNMARNTFAILSIKKGVRLDVVAKLLGHKNFYSILPYANSTTKDMDYAYGVLNEEFS